MIKAVIFDCDGVLVDSESITAEVLSHSANAVGLALTPVESRRRFTGRQMSDCLAELERELGAPIPAEFVRDFRRDLNTALRERVQPMGGADEVLCELCLPSCVASNGPREKIRITLGTTGLHRHFADDRIFSAYEVGVWKPDPGLFLHAAAAMGVAPESCVVIEDSAPGLEAGLAAGMTVYAYGAHTPPDGVRRLDRLQDLLAVV